MKTVRMEEMNWVDISDAIQKGFTTVIIGVLIKIVDIFGNEYIRKSNITTK